MDLRILVELSNSSPAINNESNCSQILQKGEMDSKPKEWTHDISLANYHIKDLKAFGETLTDAVAGAFPNKGKSRYSEVHVLLLSWEEDNLGVITEGNVAQRYFFYSSPTYSTSAIV